LFLLFATHTQAAEFIPLGDLPGGLFGSNATSVDASGTVVVGSSSNISPVAQAGAFVWTETDGLMGIGDGAGAEAVSGDGSTVVGIVSDGTLITPFVWTATSGLTSLGLPPGEPANGASTALGVSGDGGIIVGSTQFGGTTQAFRWTSGGGFVGFASDLPGGGSPSLATGISDDGKVIVGGYTDGQQRAFRWTAETGGIDLGDLPGGDIDSLANAVSADGDWVVGTASSAVSPVEAFLWSEAMGMIGIGLPSPAETTPFAVTNSGRAVVGRSDVGGVSTQAFVWTNTRGLESLQAALSSHFGLGAPLVGWTLTSANDISPDGHFIVGSGINPTGNQEAWLVRLDRPIFIPESSTLVLTLISAAIYGSQRHSKAIRL
jgi:probable HAF family extracellular repeat protein